MIYCKLVTLMLYVTGNALITVATGPMGEDLAERTGLVSAHAYAVLSIREVNVRLSVCSIRVVMQLNG